MAFKDYFIPLIESKTVTKDSKNRISLNFKKHYFRFEDEPPLGVSQFRTSPMETVRIIPNNKENTFPKFDQMIIFLKDVTTDLDKKVLLILAKFRGMMTERQISELLFMCGEEISEERFHACLENFHVYNFIEYGYFQTPMQEDSSDQKIIMLTSYGKFLTSFLDCEGIPSPFEVQLSLNPYEVKSHLQANQLVIQFIKYFPEINNFFIRPVTKLYFPELHSFTSFSPTALLNVCGEDIFIETPRKVRDYLELLSDKLSRYSQGFDRPFLVLCSEDDRMNDEINSFLLNKNLNLDIIYTVDLSLFGENFKTGFYQYDAEGNKKIFFLDVEWRK